MFSARKPWNEASIRQTSYCSQLLTWNEASIMQTSYCSQLSTPVQTHVTTLRKTRTAKAGEEWSGNTSYSFNLRHTSRQ